MHILFIHSGFPGQFRYVAPLLAERDGWRCTFLTADRRIPPPAEVAKLNYEPAGDRSVEDSRNRAEPTPMDHALGAYEALKRRPDLRPDLLVSHGSYGSTLFLPYLYDAPIVNFFEYFYRAAGQDLGYRMDDAVTERHLLRCRSRNAMTLLDLDNCDRAWCPTQHQRNLMPTEYRGKVEVVHDGIDTEAFRPMPGVARRLPDGTEIPAETRVVTYASRGFERLRGFDVFMRVAKRVYEQFPDVVFVVAGSDRIFYGSEGQRGGYATFRERVLAEGDYDLSKFRFVGKLPQAELARVLAFSDLHVYLTVPFFTSWSPLEAMSSGCVLLASDTPCVSEYITHRRNGLLCDFFDEDGMAEAALRVLRDPAAHRPLGEAARRTIEETYSIDVTLPRIKAMFEAVASKPRSPSVRAELLCRAPATDSAGRERRREVALRAQAVAKPSPEPLAPFDGAIPFGAGRPVGRQPSEPNRPDRSDPVYGSAFVAPPAARTVVFCWELGGGLGHLWQMLPLAADLAKAGHRVFVCLRHLERAAAVFGSAGVRFLQAPYWSVGTPRFAEPRNYAQMLANVGFAADGELFARAAAWRNLLRMTEPDLLVIDHGPTALLASRGLDCRRALLGSGFCCPPDADDAARWGVMRTARLGEDDSEALRAAGDDVLARVNRTLAAWGEPTLERLGRLYADVDENFLTTFPELDPFPDRAGAAYWGPVLRDRIAGNGAPSVPDWPDGRGGRVLAYLKPSPGTAHVLGALREAGCPTLAYIDGASAALRRRLESPTVSVADAPLDLRRVAETCDGAVLNGGHGATAEVLLAGKPILQVPLAQEQQLTAEATRRLGAGEIACARDGGEVRDALDRLLAGGACAAAAMGFAKRYAAFDARVQRRAMLGRAEQIIATAPGAGAGTAAMQLIAG